MAREEQGAQVHHPAGRQPAPPPARIPAVAGAVTTNVHRAGHAAFAVGRPRRCWRSLRTRARSRRWAARIPGWRALALRQRRYACRRRASTGVAGMAGVTHDEGPQGTGLRFHRVGPRRAGGRAAQLHAGALCRARIAGVLFAGQIVQDHMGAVAARAGRADGLEGGQGVVTALAGTDDAPQLVIAQAVAAVEAADAVGAVIRRGQPAGPFLPGPRDAMHGPDRQRAELVKREAPAGEMGGHVLDPVQLGVPVRVGGLLPGPGPLEADPLFVQDLPQPLPPRWPPAAGWRWLNTPPAYARSSR